MSERVTLSDLARNEIGVMIEAMDAGEVRETWYIRRDGVTKYPQNVPVYRIGVYQDVPGEKPRYEWIAGKSPYPSEADGRTPVMRSGHE